MLDKEFRVMAKFASMPFRSHSTKQQMRDFGMRVKRFRLTHQMSQEQFARAMKVTRRTVQNVERCHFIARYSTIIKFNDLVERYAKQKATQEKDSFDEAGTSIGVPTLG